MKHGAWIATLLLVAAAAMAGTDGSGLPIREGANPRLVAPMGDRVDTKWVEKPGLSSRSGPYKPWIPRGWPLWPQRPWICL